jgi:26S proteasome non-ATPase regulatory subunit 10
VIDWVSKLYILKLMTRLDPQDITGNTPLHLALDSAHAAAAVVLIEAGADRSRVRLRLSFYQILDRELIMIQLNADGQAPEEVEGVGGQEQKRALEYIVQRCGPA